MRFAAIADIHGNAPALVAVLADIAALGIVDIVNLGDCVSGPLEARRTLEILMARDIPTVRGNHDRVVANDDPRTLPPSDAAAHRQLGADHLAWLAALPPTLIWRDEVFLCHATPESDTTYWLDTVDAHGVMRLSPRDAIERRVAGIRQALILCGHTHLPRVVRLSDGRSIVNPGSVGCPAYDDETPVRHVVEAGTPDASYAVIERRDEAWQVQIRHVPYDNLAMAELASANGRPDWACALATGWLA